MQRSFPDHCPHRVVGIDPGLRVTAVASVGPDGHWTREIAQPSARPWALRVRAISAFVADVTQGHTLAVVEVPLMHPRRVRSTARLYAVVGAIIGSVATPQLALVAPAQLRSFGGVRKGKIKDALPEDDPLNSVSHHCVDAAYLAMIGAAYLSGDDVPDIKIITWRTS